MYMLRRRKRERDRVDVYIGIIVYTHVYIYIHKYVFDMYVVWKGSANDVEYSSAVNRHGFQKIANRINI